MSHSSLLVLQLSNDDEDLSLKIDALVRVGGCAFDVRVCCSVPQRGTKQLPKRILNSYTIKGSDKVIKCEASPSIPLSSSSALAESRFLGGGGGRGILFIDFWWVVRGCHVLFGTYMQKPPSVP
jgi:hypothetical protein